MTNINNGSFEEPVLNVPQTHVDERDIPAWSTTASNHKIEIWRTGFGGVEALDGDQFIEVNGRESATIYQDLCLNSGQTVTWSFWHRARVGIDVVNLTIGGINQGNFSSTTAKWNNFTGTYTATHSGYHTFEFSSVSTGSGDPTAGNFLDKIEISGLIHQLEFSSNNSSDFEYVGGNIPVIFLNAQLLNPITIEVELIGGSATEGDDFTLSSQVNIPAGNYDGTLTTAIPINLTILHDCIAEADETIEIEITNIWNNGNLLITECFKNENPQTVYTIKNSDHKLDFDFKNVSCHGLNDGEISIDASRLPMPHIFSITNNNQVINQTIGEFTSLAPGSYKITFENGNGCQSIEYVTISEPQTLNFTPVSTDFTCDKNCEGQIEFTNVHGGTQPYAYGLSGIAFQDKSLFTNLCEGQYEMVLRDKNECELKIETEIEKILSITDPISVLAHSDQTICAGDSFNISAEGIGGIGSHSFYWDDGNQIYHGAIQKNLVLYETTTFTVFLKDNCLADPVSDQITITVNPKPVVAFEGENLTGCVPITSSFKIDSASNNVTEFFWDFGDGNTSKKLTPSHIYVKAGCYDVTLKLRDENGCSNSLTEPEMVCADKFPKASFTFDPKKLTNLTPRINFTNTSYFGKYHSWDFGDGEQSSEENPSHYFNTSNSYKVTLHETSEFGCSDSTSVTIFFREAPTVFVPNTFTPDNNGLNETFKPRLFGVSPENYLMQIYNKWGEILFETHNQDEGWDGKFESENAKSDVYVWKIILEYDISKREELNGHVVLLK